MSSIDVLNREGKKIERMALDPLVFDGKINSPLMHQAVVACRANLRRGLASTKTKGKVRGGGRKPWRQKGTGRARVGSIRSPLWRGGGITFGPQVRSYNQKLPKKMGAGALKSALNAKLKDKEIVVLNELKINSHKTKSFSSLIKNINPQREKARIVVREWDNNLKLSCRNIKDINMSLAGNLNTYEVLDSKKIIFIKEALAAVEERIKKWLK